MRPNTMRYLGSATCTLVLTLGLAACGTGTEVEKPEQPAPSQAVLFGDCKADAPALDDATAVAAADLGGIGTPQKIRYVPQSVGGPCAGSLFTTVDGAPTATPLHSTELDPNSAGVVQLRGTDRQLLLVDEQKHPRGGFQTHLFGHGEDGLGEVEVSGRPLLDFVATDGGGLPVTARCTAQGGIAVLAARPHEPPKSDLAWDVSQTTYSLNGATAVEDSTKLVRKAVADKALRKQIPQLFDLGAYLADCIVEK